MTTARGEALGHVRTRWDVDGIVNWVTLMPPKELTQTLVWDAHCQGWEEVGSLGPVWVAHSPVGRAPPMTPLTGHQAPVL